MLQGSFRSAYRFLPFDFVVINEVLGQFLEADLLHPQPGESALEDLAFPEFEKPFSFALAFGVTAFPVRLPGPKIPNPQNLSPNYFTCLPTLMLSPKNPAHATPP